MQAWQATVQNEQGNVVFNPSITVYLEDGVTLASIFNEDGSPKENPFIGSLEGFAKFWANPGVYKILGANGSDLTELWEVSIDSLVYLTGFANESQAIEYMADVGGEIIVPSGVHDVAPLVLPKQGAAGRRIILRGEGQQSVLRIATTGPLIHAGDPLAQGGALGWDIRDLTIRGTNNAAGVGLFLERANSARIDGVRFEGVQDAIHLSETYGARITSCHAAGIGRDFVRALTRTFHLVLRDNGFFSSGGYFLNLTGAVPSLNIRLDSNDLEVIGGIIKSVGFIHGLSYVANYMEQSSGQMFDFTQGVTGEMTGGNTFQLSNAQSINHFTGRFDGNHVIETQVTWGTGSYPTVGNNVSGANGPVQVTPKRLASLGSAYMVQGFYDPPGFYKDSTGRVYLQGNATRDTNVPAPTLPYTLFTLPIGFRPSAPMTFAGQGTTTNITKIRITAAGDVIIDASTTNDLGLGGITFIAA